MGKIYRKENLKHLSYYFFHSERSTANPIAQWVGGEWWAPGEKISFEEMKMRGWEILFPVTCLDMEISKLYDALYFYADEKNWSSPSTGFALQYDPEPSNVSKMGHWAVAREALK